MKKEALSNYVTLTLRTAEAGWLRPLLEERLREVELYDAIGPIDAQGWQEYLELLDEPDDAGNVALPFPQAVLGELARDALAVALHFADKATKARQWGCVTHRLDEAQRFAHLLLDDQEPTPWRRL